MAWVSNLKANLTAIVLSASLLTGCGMSPLSLMKGGGPNVAANIQAGKTNSQTIGTTKNVEQRTESGDIKSVEAKVSGWLLPSPNEIGRWFTNILTRKKSNG